MQLEATTEAEALERGITRLWTMLLRGTSQELSRTTLSVLARLRDAGPQRVTALAVHEAVAQPTMTALVGRLEARGLVVRGADPGDARAVRVAITPAGLEALAGRRAERTALLEARLAALDPDERAAIDRALPALDRLTRTPETVT
jgi:DNA-binding MarR family transcriptional regulator